MEIRVRWLSTLLRQQITFGSSLICVWRRMVRGKQEFGHPLPVLVAYGDWGNGDGFDIFNKGYPNPYNWPKDADVNRPNHGTALSAYALDTAASIASVLQLDAIARNDTSGANSYGGYYTNFTNFAAKARTAYTNASNGLVQYDGGGAINRVGTKSSQSDCMSALYFDMIPPSQRPNVLNLLFNVTNLGIVNYNVRYTNDGYNPVFCTNRLSSGYVYAAREMLELSRNGYTGKAYELLMHTNFPSWLYPVVNGTTTIWEYWNTYKAHRPSV